jgi:hypothetical protein
MEFVEIFSFEGWHRANRKKTDLLSLFLLFSAIGFSQGKR